MNSVRSNCSIFTCYSSLSRFNADTWDERQFGREGLKAGDVISLLIHAERGPSRRTLTGLVHNVVHKPKPKNAVYPKFNMIRELWVWVSSSAAVHDVSDIRYIHQCISLQCSEKVNVALSWGFSFVACPNSACSIMGVKDVAITSKTLDIHNRSTEYEMNEQSLFVKAFSDEAISKSQHLIAFSIISSKLRISISKQPIVPIVGPPGTGKTRVSAELLSHFIQNSEEPLWCLCTAWTNQAVYVLADACTKTGIKADFVLVGSRHQCDQRTLTTVTYLSSFNDEGWDLILRSSKSVIIFATIGLLSRPMPE